MTDAELALCKDPVIQEWLSKVGCEQEWCSFCKTTARERCFFHPVNYYRIKLPTLEQLLEKLGDKISEACRNAQGDWVVITNIEIRDFVRNRHYGATLKEALLKAAIAAEVKK